MVLNRCVYPYVPQMACSTRLKLIEQACGSIFRYNFDYSCWWNTLSVKSTWKTKTDPTKRVVLSSLFAQTMCFLLTSIFVIFFVQIFFYILHKQMYFVYLQPHTFHYLYLFVQELRKLVIGTLIFATSKKPPQALTKRVL